MEDRVTYKLEFDMYLYESEGLEDDLERLAEVFQNMTAEDIRKAIVRVGKES
jgi:hypothetical protein